MSTGRCKLQICRLHVNQWVTLYSAETMVLDFGVRTNLNQNINTRFKTELGLSFGLRPQSKNKVLVLNQSFGDGCMNVT